MSEASVADPISHFHVVLLEVDRAETLDGLLQRRELRGLIWTRLDGTRALVDPARLQTLQQRLRAAGAPACISSRLDSSTRTA